MAIASCGEIIGIVSSIRVAKFEFRFLEVLLSSLMDHFDEHFECLMKRLRQIILSTFSCLCASLESSLL